MYEIITAEIDRMIEKGEDYAFPTGDRGGRGWLFCPDYAGATPLELSPAGWETRVFLFGPGLLPDTSFRQGPAGPFSLDDTPRQYVVSESLPVTAQHAPRNDIDHASPQLTEKMPEDSTGSPNADEKRHLPEPPETVPSICLGTDLMSGNEVRWPLTIQGNPHLLVAGLPGMGKTTCLLNLCQQMLSAGIRPIVFSYHQDIDERLAHGRRELSPAVFPYVRRFYEGWLDESGRDPFYRPNSRY